MKRSIFVALMVVLLGSAFSARAEAAPIACGSVLSTAGTFTITHNITDCGTSPAISITHDDVVLDLNGHTVDGTGVGTGIQSTGANDHVTIKNGTVRDFNTEVNIQGGHAVAAKRLHILAGGFGVSLSGTAEAVVASNRMTVSSTGVVDSGGDGDVIRRNVMTGGVFGVDLVSSTTSAFVSGNTITNANDGIEVNTSGPSFSRISGNTIRGGASGIDVSSTAINEQIVGNDVRKAVVNGIHVSTSAATIAIGRNTADGNTHDGIFVETTDPGTSIADNVADNNGDLGIEAQPGNDDVGGNEAHGNGNAYQCIQVFCT